MSLTRELQLPGTFAVAGLPRERACESPDVKWWVTLAYCGFIFSIPFEYPARTIPMEVHTITAAIFLLVAAMQPSAFFRMPPMAFWGLAGYLWMYLARMLFVDHFDEARRLSVNYVIVTLLFWTGSSLMARERIARLALFSFVLGCVGISMLTIVGTYSGALQGRGMVLGQDANLLGGNMALGLMILMILTFGVENIWTPKTIGAVAIAALLAKAIVAAGSRGAILATAGGVVAFAAGGGTGKTAKRNMAIVLLVLGALFAAVYHSDSMWNRYTDSVAQGDMSGREDLYPEAWQMFLEKPLLGWGPIDNMYELGLRTASLGIGKKNADGLSTAENRDTHNLILDILTSVGVIGSAPLIICLGLCAGAAWKARRGPRGPGPLALMAVVLLLSMDTNWSASKQGWTILAYVAVSGSRFVVNRSAQLPRAA